MNPEVAKLAKEFRAQNKNVEFITMRFVTMPLSVRLKLLKGIVYSFLGIDMSIAMMRGNPKDDPS